MFHKENKDNRHVRKALFESFKHKCAYCGDLIMPKNMHVDHILASNHSETKDADFDTYYSELMDAGFVYDCLENYLPTCASCNLTKNNKNFTTANLRFFHQKALDHLDKTLEQYELAKTQQADFPSVDESLTFWKIVDFSYQHDISYAISQYRLGPADVCACPRFEQVEEIKNCLCQVDYVTVQGKPGCGKSITIFQTAFDFFKDGWTVFRLINSNEYLKTPNLLEKSKSLYIVDDAQNIPKFVIDSLADQARSEKKIIFGKTENEEYSRDCIIITEADAVRAIKSNYSKRIAELTPIVHAHDKRVGERSLDYPLEYRIEDAAKATTPWQFNYILCGGWKTIRSQYLSIARHNQCGLLCAAIAAFQIAQLDKSVDYMWLRRFFAEIDSTINWSDEDLTILVDKKIVLSMDDIRIVHLRSANIVLAQFYKNASDQDKILLQKAIEVAYEQKLFPILGLVWIVNGTSSYFDDGFYTGRILTERFLDSLLTNLSVYKTPTEQMHVAYLLSITRRVSYSHDELFYTKKNLRTLANWISQACTENAYAFSEIVNDLINYDIALHKELTEAVNWDVLFQSFSKSDAKGLYSWGRLINRLTYSVNTEDQRKYADKIFVCCTEMYTSIRTRDLPDFSCFLSNVYHLNPELVSNLLLSHIADYQALWLQDATQIVEVFDFHFLAYLCGECGLTKQKPTKVQKKVDRALVSSLPVKEIAAFASCSRSRHWRTLYEVFLLIKQYDAKKLTEICNLIDLKTISETTKSFWEKTDDDLFFLCYCIALGNPQKAEQLMYSNKDKIRHLRLPLIEISPRLAIELSVKGIGVSLIDNGWWDLTRTAIGLLIDQDKEAADMIIQKNDASISNAISSICVLDLENSFLLESLKLIGNNKRSTLELVVNQIDLAMLQKHVLNTLSDSRTTRTAVKRLHELIDYLALFSSNSQSFLELKKIRRHGSSRRSNVTNNKN